MKIDRTFWGWLAVSAGVMLLLPWGAVTFIPSLSGMAALITLFFAVDPLYCFVLGFCAGRRLRILWSLPLLAAGLFLLGCWLLLSPGNLDFFVYAGAYLLLGTAAMALSAWLTGRKKG